MSSVSRATVLLSNLGDTRKLPRLSVNKGEMALMRMPRCVDLGGGMSLGLQKD